MSDALDIEQHDQLLAYLRATNRIGGKESLQIRTLAGGVSNKTVWLERPTGEAWVLKQALSKLRVTVDWFSDPARIEREALGLRWLATLAPQGAITPLIFVDLSHHLLAMMAVPQPHENWKTLLLSGQLDLDHVKQFAELLAAIHRGSIESSQPLRYIFDERSFYESLRLEPYYAYAAAQVPEARDFLTRLIADTRLRRLCLVHGDYSPKNVLVRDGRLVLLDHEVIHWGDPAFDIGFALTHLLSKAHHLRDDRFVGAAKLFCDIYSARVGPALWNEQSAVMAARHTLGCLLARVAGRSPLEYLDDAKRARQRDAVVKVMQGNCKSVSDVIDQIANQRMIGKSGA
jgi:aminoglycoside phosphotransferase (APT) family kinase protein